mmetsp:Transcript_1312/g.1992  ORF Transcript_1312/g.1992 Transcript_1312/m.1992 type:complete len:85 (-) Transcript_1312:45-299(-)
MHQKTPSFQLIPPSMLFEIFLRWKIRGTLHYLVNNFRNDFVFIPTSTEEERWRFNIIKASGVEDETSASKTTPNQVPSTTLQML